MSKLQAVWAWVVANVKAAVTYTVIVLALLVLLAWYFGFKPTAGTVSGNTEELMKFLVDKARPGKALEARKEIIRRGDDNVVDALVDTLVKADGPTALVAANTLVRIGPNAAEPLFRELSATTDPTVKGRLDYVLVRIREAVARIEDEGQRARMANEMDRLLRQINGEKPNFCLTKPSVTSKPPVCKPQAPKPKAPAVKPPVRKTTAYQPHVSIGRTAYNSVEITGLPEGWYKSIW